MKDMTHEQLIRATYVVAKYENPKTAQLLTELAGRLDCALVAARTACLERDSAVRAEVEWETAMRQAVGEDGVDDVVLAIEKLKAGLDVQSARSDALAAELARYSMPAGEADQRMAESRAVRQALGFGQDADDVAPVDLVERLNALAAALKASEANDADARCHVAELEEKCAALAAKLSDVCAENAALKKFIREKCFVVPDGASCFAEADECAEKKMPETPATDVWVNEQRAVGVDGAIEKLITMLNHQSTGVSASINVLRTFAAQLRGSQV